MIVFCSQQYYNLYELWLFSVLSSIIIYVNYDCFLFSAVLYELWLFFVLSSLQSIIFIAWHCDSHGSQTNRHLPDQAESADEKQSPRF